MTAETEQDEYRANSLPLWGAVALGTGVMIGAGIFALTGQVAELAGAAFPLVFLVAAIIAGFSAYSYVKMAAVYPSAGGIAMFLEKAYGPGLITGVCALLMALSMVINQSLVARTFGTYTLQLFDAGAAWLLTPALGVGLLLFALAINLASNKSISTISFVLSAVKIIGIVIFAFAGLWVANGITPEISKVSFSFGAELGFVAALAPAILAYKGFTTITNSGSEITNPERNVGLAIIISLLICVAIYLLVTLAVSANLTVDEIIAARDFALAEASKPALGQFGLTFTVALAIVATASGIIASVFAVSRMLTMLTKMKLMPHHHLGMSGPLRRHMLVYTVGVAILMTVFLDLTRIASLGAILYLIMDIAIHWGVLRHLKKEVNANAIVLISAIGLDVIVLGAFVIIKVQSDIMIIAIAIATLVLITSIEWWFLHNKPKENGDDQNPGSSQ